MVKKIIFLFCIVILNGFADSYSQETKKQFIHKGLLRATGTIAPTTSSNIYLHGVSEYYVADNISIRGEIFYSMKSSFFEYNHSLFTGPSYHFKTSNHFDPYFGLQPGIAASKRNDYSLMICDPAACPDYYSNLPEQEFSPLISPLIGFNFYFERWFHLFMETRYVIGKHISTDGFPPHSLSEFRFSFGLGFNLSVFKPKTPSSPSK